MERQSDLLARLKTAAGMETVTELAAFFGVRMALIFDWRRRGHIPKNYQDALRANGIDPHWVLTGEEERLRLP